jgi:hypothetical protein
LRVRGSAAATFQGHTTNALQNATIAVRLDVRGIRSIILAAVPDRA